MVRTNSTTLNGVTEECICVIPAARRLRQKDFKFTARRRNLGRCVSKQNLKTRAGSQALWHTTVIPALRNNKTMRTIISSWEREMARAGNVTGLSKFKALRVNPK